MKKVGILLMCGISLAGLRQARAGAQLRLSDGNPADTVVVTDEGPNDSASGQPGVVEYSGSVGTWFVNITTGSTYPNLGTADAPAMDVGTLNLSGSGGTLTIDFTQDGFTTPGAAALSLNGSSDGAVSYQVYVDPANQPFAKTTLIGTIANGSVSGNTNGMVSSGTPYSMTIETVIQHAGGGQTAFDANVVVTPVTCNCNLSFTSPSSITNCEGDAILAATAVEDCGSGPTPAIVTVTGATTNGVCPQIITITNSATDGCGTVHTFVQTVTVNCKPDCTITPSVTTATVGCSNYTASVADAGVGASYSWSIVNGTITAGQGTSQITWAAGTDLSNPVTIVVLVTSPTGCQSSCTASVLLVPKPLPLGSGDAAMIGFWHGKNGLGLINGAANSPALGNWLATSFPHLYGSLAGQPNGAVAALFTTDFNKQKTDAQVMSAALACYFTSSNLGGGNASAKFGFNISPAGTGAKIFNVGADGTALGLQNNASYTITQLLQVADAKCPSSPAVISKKCAATPQCTAVVNTINDLFSRINQKGNID